MDKKRGIVVFVICLLLIFSKAYSQLSPGELTKAHANLEGLANCTKCHVLGEKETSSKCLECHKEIRLLIGQNKGYHSSSEVKGKKCAECHGEHFGRDFKIVRFDENNFDHKLAKFELTGKHSRIKCIDCHQQAHIKTKISQKKGNTFLGMGTECLSCHEDFHQKTLSSDCLICHNQETFRPATGFNHSKTRFPLIGKHQNVSCRQCHKIEKLNGRDFQKFSDIAFENCTDCHIDVHQNKFGQDCRKCHSEFSFHEPKTLSSFNHEKTDFPLVGKHAFVDCKKCHTGSLTKPVKHKNCADCHSDYHKNQFRKNGISPDCAVCHSVEGFSPSSFGIEKHNLTTFPLEGSHLATSCFDCHKRDGNWNFGNIGKQCVNCHQNIHKTYIPEKYMPGDNCKNCHQVTVWNSVSFNHTLTDYPLLGKHAEVTCKSCHFKESDGTLKQQFSNLAGSCKSCHTDVHFNQFEVLDKNDCERCHTFNSWLPEKFNHSNTRFKLDGEHIGLRCAECHKPVVDLTHNYIVYKFEDISCASCH